MIPYDLLDLKRDHLFVSAASLTQVISHFVFKFKIHMNNTEQLASPENTCQSDWLPRLCALFVCLFVCILSII